MKAKCWLSPLHTCPVATAMCWPERGPLCLFGRSMKGLSYLRGSCPQLSSVWHPALQHIFQQYHPLCFTLTDPAHTVMQLCQIWYCTRRTWTWSSEIKLQWFDRRQTLSVETALRPCILQWSPAVTENRAQAEVAEPACWNLPDTYQSFAAARFGIIHFHSWNQRRVHYRHQWAAMVPQEPSLCCPGRARCLPLIHRLLTI